MKQTMENSTQCAVIGHGSWATALVKLLSQTQPKVNWFVRNPEVMESLRMENRNCRYLSDIEFDPSRLSLSSDINETVRDADIVFLVTPSVYLKSYLSSLEVSLKDKIIVSAIKGIIPGEYQTVTEYVRDHYGLSSKQIGFISGPTHAEEVSHGRLAHLTVACTDFENAKLIGKQLKTNFIFINYVQETVVLEYAAVLKNIYAVVVGIAVGLGYGDNFVSVLVSNCAGEMIRFFKKQCPLCIEALPSSFLGDLLVSCYSSHSRNRQLGVLIGRGNTVKSALNEMTMVAEGYFAAEYIRFINSQDLKNAPITEMAYQVLYKDMPARKAMKDLETKLV